MAAFDLQRMRVCKAAEIGNADAAWRTGQGQTGNEAFLTLPSEDIATAVCKSGWMDLHPPSLGSRHPQEPIPSGLHWGFVPCPMDRRCGALTGVSLDGTSGRRTFGFASHTT